jgi:hypothetical protein
MQLFALLNPHRPHTHRPGVYSAAAAPAAPEPGAGAVGTGTGTHTGDIATPELRAPAEPNERVAEEDPWQTHACDRGRTHGPARACALQQRRTRSWHASAATSGFRAPASGVGGSYAPRAVDM